MSAASCHPVRRLMCRLVRLSACQTISLSACQPAVSHLRHKLPHFPSDQLRSPSNPALEYQARRNATSYTHQRLTCALLAPDQCPPPCTVLLTVPSKADAPSDIAPRAAGSAVDGFGAGAECSTLLRGGPRLEPSRRPTGGGPQLRGSLLCQGWLTPSLGASRT